MYCVRLIISTSTIRYRRSQPTAPRVRPLPTRVASAQGLRTVRPFGYRPLPVGIINSTMPAIEGIWEIARRDMGRGNRWLRRACRHILDHLSLEPNQNRYVETYAWKRASPTGCRCSSFISCLGDRPHFDSNRQLTGDVDRVGMCGSPVTQPGGAVTQPGRIRFPST